MSLLDLASLVLAPTATKEGKVYSAIPDTGDGDMTFTRGSGATRVNSAGLIEKERANRLLQSNNFNTSPYSPAFATVTSGFEGYDGSNDAWKVASTTIGSETRIRQSQTFTTGEVITLSVYMKKGNVNFGIVRTYAITGGGRAWFDLENGTVGTTNSGINGSIEDVGNGWYRCSIWGVIDTTGAVDIAPAPTDGDYLADAVGEFIYIQDSMLNQGLVAQPYIETTTTAVYEGITDDVPRVDYSGGGCPSLLLEPQRTNSIIDSEYFSSGWTKFGGSTIEVGYQSPEGLNNAVKATRGSNRTLMRSNNYATLSVNNVLSIYAKSGNINKISLDIGDEGETEFDLTDEWQRFDIVVNPSTYRFCDIAMPNSSSSGDYFYIYGAMLETSASYPSSYIPTYGTSTTRVADSCSKTGISDLIGQTEGTLFVETTDWQLSLDTLLFSVSDGSTSNYIQISTNSSTGNLQSVIFAGGSGTLLGSTTPTAGQRLKIAIGYKVNDYALYVNGTQIGTLTSKAAPTTLTRTDIGSLSWFSSGFQPRPKFAQAILFPTRLTNDQLEELTK